MVAHAARSGLTATTRPALRAARVGRPAGTPRVAGAAPAARALPADESADLMPVAPPTPAPAVRPAAPGDYAKATIKVCEGRVCGRSG